jgi:hypothetical protein
LRYDEAILRRRLHGKIDKNQQLPCWQNPLLARLPD